MHREGTFALTHEGALPNREQRCQQQAIYDIIRATAQAAAAAAAAPPGSALRRQYESV